MVFLPRSRHCERSEAIQPLHPDRFASRRDAGVIAAHANSPCRNQRGRAVSRLVETFAEQPEASAFAIFGAKIIARERMRVSTIPARSAPAPRWRRLHAARAASESARAAHPARWRWPRSARAWRAGEWGGRESCFLLKCAGGMPGLSLRCGYAAMVDTSLAWTLCQLDDERSGHRRHREFRPMRIGRAPAASRAARRGARPAGR